MLPMLARRSLSWTGQRVPGPQQVPPASWLQAQFHSIYLSPNLAFHLLHYMHQDGSTH